MGCGAAGGAAAGPKKTKKKKTVAPKAPPAPVPVPEPEVLLEPLFFQQPIATTSQLIPSYSMVAAPQMTYAAPATTTYAQQYAAPATTAYTQPAFAQQYAAPATTAYATGVGGYPMGTMSGYNTGAVV